MKFTELTPYQIELLKLSTSSNGCGSKGGFLKPPYAAFFKASCDWHDISYFQGGFEADRIEADIGFFKAMLLDCERIEGLYRIKYIVWAHLYFFAVRVAGKNHFTYRTKKLSIEELLVWSNEGL